MPERQLPLNPQAPVAGGKIISLGLDRTSSPSKADPAQSAPTAHRTIDVPRTLTEPQNADMPMAEKCKDCRLRFT
jgi:hypothetical protein